MRTWLVLFTFTVGVLVWLQLLSFGLAGMLLFGAMLPVFVPGIKRINGKNVVTDKVQATRSVAAFGYASIGAFVGMLSGLVLTMMVTSRMSYSWLTNPILSETPLLIFFGFTFGGAWIGYHIAKKNPPR